MNFETNKNFETIPEELEKNEALKSFTKQAEDFNFLSRLRGSELAKIARRLSLLVAFVAPEILAQSPEDDLREMQKQVEIAKTAEEKILSFAQAQGEFVRKDYKRINEGNKDKIVQKGFARTNGQRIQIQETGIWRNSDGKYQGTANYWEDKDLDGSPEMMVSVDGVEPTESIDSLALSYFDKNFEGVTSEVTGENFPTGKVRIYTRDGSSWKFVKVGSPEVIKMNEDSFMPMQEKFSSTTDYVAQKIEKGVTF